MSHTDYLISFIKANNIKRIAEVGVYKGKCYREILRQCTEIEEYWGIDRYTAYNDPSFAMGCKTQDEWDSIYLRNCFDMTFFPQLKIVKGESITISKFWNKPYFDLVFIDADHRKEYVLADIFAWKPLVKRFLSGHDYGKGHSKGHRVEEAVNEIFTKEQIKLAKNGIWYVEIEGKNLLP